MMKIFVSLFLSLFLFIGCGNIVNPNDAASKKLQQQIEVGDKLYQFLYPENATVTNVNGEGEMSFSSSTCLLISYGNVENFKKRVSSVKDLENVEIKKDEDGEHVFESWFLDKALVFYAKSLKENDFGFIAFNDLKAQEDCVVILDDLFESLSSELAYINEKFAYKVEMPVDFKVDYLENGLILKSWIEPKDGEDFEPHKIEIVVWPIENFDKDQDLATFVAEKYSGFSLEGKDFSGFSGYFVDESSPTMEAKRHFFTMSEDKTIIYEAYLQVKSKYYPRHKDFFDKFVENNIKLL